MDKVKLIAVTQPVDTNMTSEQLIAYMARVSNAKNQDNKLTAKKLLKYLVKNQHFSPFEMVNLVIEIETPRAIARQILRHRSFSFQEFSQRYSEVDHSMFTTLDARLQDPTNRQNSNPTEDCALQLKWITIQEFAVHNAITLYKEALELGIAKELARAVLPEGLTMSRLYMNGTLRSWIHYCNLRMGNGTQKEHQDIAKECWKIILEQFPALEDILIG